MLRPENRSRLLGRVEEGREGGRGLGVVIGRRFLAFIRVAMKSWKALPLIYALIHLLFPFFRIFLHRISETIETSTISFMRVFLLGFRIPITLPIISSAFYSNFLTS